MSLISTGSISLDSTFKWSVAQLGKWFLNTVTFVVGLDLAELLASPTANANIATVLGLIPASSDTVESEGR